MAWLDTGFGSRPWAWTGCAKITNENMSSSAQDMLLSVISELWVNTCKLQILFYILPGNIFQPSVHCSAFLDIHSTLLS